MRVPQEAVDGRAHSFPVLSFDFELFPSAGGDRVELRAAVIFGSAPFGGDPAFLFHAEERGVECALVEVQEIFADLLDAARDAVAVEGPDGFQRPQDQEDEVPWRTSAFAAGSLLVLATYRSIAWTPLGNQQKRPDVGKSYHSGSIEQIGPTCAQSEPNSACRRV
jgi:hypothetical protein